MADSTASDSLDFSSQAERLDFSGASTLVEDPPPDFSLGAASIDEVAPPKVVPSLQQPKKSFFSRFVEEYGRGAQAEMEGVKEASKILTSPDPIVNFSPRLFTPSGLALVSPKTAGAVGERASEIASGLTSPQNIMIGASALIAPEVAIPILAGVGVKEGARAAGAMTGELEAGNIPEAAAEAVSIGAASLMVAPGLIGAARGLGKGRLGEVPPKIKEVKPPEIPFQDAETLLRPTEPPQIVTPKGPSFEVVQKTSDLHAFNRVNSGQWNFYFGRMGETAQQAWTKMALDEMKMRESIGRDVNTIVERTVDSIPKPMRKDGAKAFTDVLDGKTIAEITTEWAAKPDGDLVIQAATRVKVRLEEIRETIRDTKTAQYEAFLEKKTRDELADIHESVKGSRPDDSLDKAALIRSLADEQYPADWGISDGSYFPHIFSGNWKVMAEDGSFVMRAQTPMEAKIQLREMTVANPGLASKKFTIVPDVAIPADIVRLGDKQFFGQVNRIAKSLEVPASEVADAQRGILGRKASKQKFFGNLLKREGAENFERSFEKSMTAYLHGFHRWRVLSELQRDVAPMIEKVRSEGRRVAADRLDMLMENLWGKPTKATVEFDNFLQSIPILRDRLKPLALERWTRNLRSVTAGLTLTTARFAVLNRLQPLQGLYPILGERMVLRAKMLQHSAEGRQLLDKHGVTFDVGQYGEIGVKGSVASYRERFTGEKSNQELAFLAMYLHGRERGFSADQAASYAKLRGQLMTQFTPLVVDTPQLMEGPIGATVFQFKRFPIKQVELLATMASDRNVPAITRWLGGMTAAGGTMYWLKQTYLNDEARVLKLRMELAESLGEKGADLVLYGLPGFAGADMTGSLVMGDAPFGENVYEKLGRSLTGPAISIGIKTADVATKDEREPVDALDRLRNIMRGIPTLKPLATLMDFGETDVRSPDGEIAYRRRLTDALMALGSFRTANESNLRITIDGIIAVKKERTSAKNAAFVAEMEGDEDRAVKLIEDFNARWPEFTVTATEYVNYKKFRRSRLGKTDVERLGTGKLEDLVPAEQKK